LYAENKENIPDHANESLDNIGQEFTESLQSLTVHEDPVYGGKESLSDIVSVEAVCEGSLLVEEAESNELDEQDPDDIAQAGSIFARDGPRTPTVSWKLSKSTKNILNNADMDGVFLAVQDDESDYDNAAADLQRSYCYGMATPDSPDHLNMTRTSMHASFDAKGSNTPGISLPPSMITPDASSKKLQVHTEDCYNFPFIPCSDSLDYFFRLG